MIAHSREGRFEPIRYFVQEAADDLRRDELHRTHKVMSVFRSFIERVESGWVDIIYLTERLAALRAADGEYDLVWAEMRTEPPPEPDETPRTHVPEGMT